MTTPLIQAKAVLREEIRARVKAMPAPLRAALSSQLCARLQEQELWQSAATVFFFAPLLEEPDVWPLLETTLAAGKTVLLPRFDPATNGYIACRIQTLEDVVQTGKFGIREPAETCPAWPLNRLDLALVPGVAFDVNGWRLGRGKAHYDRLLPSVSGAKCGVGFDEQIVGEIPREPHDIRLDYILTPTHWRQAAAVLK